MVKNKFETMIHIMKVDEMCNSINEYKDNFTDEEAFLSEIGFRSFEDIQRSYTEDWYDRSTYGGGRRTYVPNIVPMKIIASAVGRYIKSNQKVTVRPNMNITYICGNASKPFFTFIVEQNGKEAAIHFDDGEITHYGEDMTTPAITVHYSGKMSTIKSLDRRKFGDTDWHESEMKYMSDRLLQILNDILN